MTETQEAAIAEGRRLYGAQQFKPALKQFTIVCIKHVDLEPGRLTDCLHPKGDAAMCVQSARQTPTLQLQELRKSGIRRWLNLQ